MNENINKATGTSVLCYFCNQTISDNHSLQHHMKQCGSLLEKCERNCGVWVERKNKHSHLQRCCQRNSVTDLSTLSSRYSTGPAFFHTDTYTKEKNATKNNMMELMKEFQTLRSMLIEERIQRDVINGEIDKLKRQYVLSEERNQIFTATLVALRKHYDEELAKEKITLKDVREEFNHMYSQYINIREFVAGLEVRLGSLQKTVEYESNERSQLEMVVNTQDSKLRNINKIEEELGLLKNDKNVMNSSKNEQTDTLQKELCELKVLVSQENILNKHKCQQMEVVQDELEKKLKNTSETMTCLDGIKGEVQALRIILDENSISFKKINEKIDSLTDSVESVQNNETKTVQIVREINNVQPNISNTTGRLIWRINNYHEKMKEAISNGVIYQSPIFLTDIYGYTLQGELNLNGIGKWNGRHLTMTVYIIAGDYDPILEWPASLQADVIIKDQTSRKKQAVDIVKTLSLKMKEDNDVTQNNAKKNIKKADKNEPKRQYIFIPHTTLDKLDYVKDNVMFIEIFVSKT